MLPTSFDSSWIASDRRVQTVKPISVTATATQTKEHRMMDLTTEARFEAALRSSVSVRSKSRFAQKRRIHPEGSEFGCLGNEMPIPAMMAGITCS